MTLITPVSETAWLNWKGADNGKKGVGLADKTPIARRKVGASLQALRLAQDKLREAIFVFCRDCFVVGNSSQ
jgi:hypothetical protein